MAKVLAIFYLFNSLFIAKVLCAKGYYWRDYDGTIPEDALPAGTVSNSTFYIGQAYIHKYGLMLGTIFPRKKEITVPCHGVRKAMDTIKILCSEEPDDFFWMKSTTPSYKRDIENETPVAGGVDYVNKENVFRSTGILHVGRTIKNDEVIIGNIAAYEINNAWFYYPYLGREIASPDFEVLMYKKDSLKEMGIVPRVGNFVDTN